MKLVTMPIFHFEIFPSKEKATEKKETYSKMKPGIAIDHSNRNRKLHIHYGRGL